MNCFSLQSFHRLRDPLRELLENERPFKTNFLPGTDYEQYKNIKMILVY